MTTTPSTPATENQENAAPGLDRLACQLANAYLGYGNLVDSHWESISEADRKAWRAAAEVVLTRLRSLTVTLSDQALPPALEQELVKSIVKHCIDSAVWQPMATAWAKHAVIEAFAAAQQALPSPQQMMQVACRPMPPASYSAQDRAAWWDGFDNVPRSDLQGSRTEPWTQGRSAAEAWRQQRITELTPPTSDYSGMMLLVESMISGSNG